MFPKWSNYYASIQKERKMNLPKSGRVVIIDDKFEEALPLIRILSKDRVSVTFFSGREEELPLEPFRDIRIVFMDLVLEGVDIRNEKIIKSTIIGVVKKIVSKENGPFILVIWTKHSELTEKIQETLKEEGYYILVVDLEKHEFFEWENEKWLFKESKIEELHKEIEVRLNRIDIFKVFIGWENLAHNAASITVDEVSKLAEYNDQWNEEIKKIFYNLAKAWAGKKINELEDKEKIRSALYTFHQIFSDIFEKELQQMNLENVTLEDGDIDNLTKGKINSQILLDKSSNNNIYPGNIYNLEDFPSLKEMIKKESVIKDTINWESLKNIYNKNYKDSNISKNKFNQEFVKVATQKAKLVYLEVTPICDFIQSKMTFNRLVLGVIYPFQLMFTINDNKIELEILDKRESLIKQRTEFLYITPLFEYQNGFYFIAFDLRYFTSIPPDLIKDKSPIFRLRKELLSDIQIKLSSHINRTGVLYLD